MRAAPAAAAGTRGGGGTHLSSLRKLPTTYKAALLDQFGVLHSGVEPYPGEQKYSEPRLRRLPPPTRSLPAPPPPTLRFGPGAVDAVRFLAHERGMQLLVLSNSSRRAAGALANLAKVGRAPLTGAECGRAPLARPTRTPLSGARRWGLTVRHLRAWSPAGR